MLKVEELKDQKLNASIEGLFVISKIELIPFKNKEGSFLSCTLSDRTGEVRGVIWESAAKKAADFSECMVAKVRGEVSRYADKPQLVIVSFEKTEEYDRSQFIKTLPKEERVKLRKCFLQIQESIQDETCRRVWKAVDTKSFWGCPGGKGDVHHNYLGGLAEHVIYMMNDSKPYIKQYGLDGDLLLTGILVHDIGKIRAYDWDVTIEMSLEGRLLGHLIIGAQMILEIFGASSEESLKDPKIMKLIHMIVSHHGEHGPVKPQFKEAVILNCLDGANAAINRVMTLEDEVEDGALWTRYDWCKERYFLIDKKLNKEHSKEEFL